MFIFIVSKKLTKLFNRFSTATNIIDNCLDESSKLIHECMFSATEFPDMSCAKQYLYKYANVTKNWL